MSENKITKVTISPMPVKLFDPMPTVTAVFDNGTQEELFQYYPDELSFTEAELIGLTREQAFDLRRSKDVTYLRS